MNLFCIIELCAVFLSIAIAVVILYWTIKDIRRQEDEMSDMEKYIDELIKKTNEKNN